MQLHNRRCTPMRTLTHSSFIDTTMHQHIRRHTQKHRDRLVSCHANREKRIEALPDRVTVAATDSARESKTKRGTHTVPNLSQCHENAQEPRKVEGQRVPYTHESATTVPLFLLPRCLQLFSLHVPVKSGTQGVPAALSVSTHCVCTRNTATNSRKQTGRYKSWCRQKPLLTASASNESNRFFHRTSAQGCEFAQKHPPLS